MVHNFDFQHLTMVNPKHLILFLILSLQTTTTNLIPKIVDNPIWVFKHWNTRSIFYMKICTYRLLTLCYCGPLKKMCDFEGGPYILRKKWNSGNTRTIFVWGHLGCKMCGGGRKWKFAKKMADIGNCFLLMGWVFGGNGGMPPWCLYWNEMAKH